MAGRATPLQGIQGIQGIQGPPGIQQLVTVHAHKDLPPGAVDFVIASCPSGTKAITGESSTGAEGGLFIAGATGYLTGWIAAGDNFYGPITAGLDAWAYCTGGVTVSSTAVAPSAAKVTAQQIAQHSLAP